MDSLSSGERTLLKKLLVMSMQGEKMEILTINKILGVGKKDESVQKTRRSIAITNINQAFSLTLRAKGQLIMRERDPLDKRTYRYFIGEAHFGILSGLH